jgi:putative acetyltransferase
MIDILKIQAEKEADIDRIEEIVIDAFAGVAYSNQKEHLIVTELRKQGALSVSLVAEQENHVIGHIAFSPITIGGEDHGWFGLGPVAVDPKVQSQGIGAKLVLAGLQAIKELGAKGCVVLGNPNYYRCFGFKVNDTLTLDGVPPEYFMAQAFDDTTPVGVVEYHLAFTTYG